MRLAAGQLLLPGESRVRWGPDVSGGNSFELLRLGVRFLWPGGTPTSDEIQIVYDEIQLPDGEKGVFGATARVVTRVGTLDSDALARNLDGFLHRVAPAFLRVSRALGDYELNQVEISLSVTAKGEVRLVGGVSSEVNGGIRLTFERRPASSP